ncbi:MAG: hypothetical protein ACJ8DI_14995 [Ktedonobacteraceae bacterium]
MLSAAKHLAADLSLWGGVTIGGISQTLCCAQGDSVRYLGLMRIGADKSGLEMHYYLPPRQGPTFGYASLWLMRRGGGHGEPAPTLSLRLLANN